MSNIASLDLTPSMCRGDAEAGSCAPWDLLKQIARSIHIIVRKSPADINISGDLYLDRWDRNVGSKALCVERHLGSSMVE
jgi:hypothetical protein